MVWDHTVYSVQKRGFPSPAGSDDAYKIPFRNGQCDVVKRVCIPGCIPESYLLSYKYT